MNGKLNRREVLSVAAAALAVPARALAAKQELEIQIAPVSAHTFRLTAFPIVEGKLAPIPEDLCLAQASWGAPVAKLRAGAKAQAIKAGGVSIRFTPEPLTFQIGDVQELKLDAETGVLAFQAGSAPLLGLGEGGPGFDRRGNVDRMRSGQGGYQLRTFGGKVPIAWLIGTGGWAMFIHAPYGSFDLTGAEGRFLPPGPPPVPAGQPAQQAPPPFPLDLFFVTSKDPALIMAEYARITGHAEMAPLWSFGYQQSHRTLGTPEEILAEAKTFREKKLPCDAMIYLGTGFCPNGWNTDNTKFDWNPRAFPDPKGMIEKLHQDHMNVVVHVAYPTGIREMSGAVKDTCDPNARAERQASCYWDMHRKVLAAGVDGWWPDEGDALNLPSRLVRNRMYWDAYQMDRPNERPYALHRNGAAGMQRYASFLWSGDVNSQWETLRNHIPNAINTGLSGVPYWGTDIGGFVPTRELTGELYVRWFQFGAFNTLFRSHGRTWKLRLPWGWNTGETGPVETPNVPLDPKELHNAQVEPICRKYLELRYRLMPYLYSAVRECTQTGLPVIRALWLHYPGDAAAVARGDVYLWGPNLLVAPVVEQGATSRKLYLPLGAWFDFWSGERVEGGREITRAVDLETMPLYARAGGIVPMGPLKQYTAEKVEGPTEVRVYPGANGSFLLYEDDGRSFDFRKGEWMGIDLTWNDARRTLSARLAHGSKALGRRELEIKVGAAAKRVTFDGKALEVRL